MAPTNPPQNHPPIYRHLLAGAPEIYCLPLRSFLLLLVIGAGVLAVSLAAGRPLESSEADVGRCAQRMLAEGRWLPSGLPVNGAIDVPPVDCWMVAGSMAVFGQDNWVVRFPSAVATLATALLLTLMSTRWFGRRVGILAGLVYLSMAGVLVSSGLSGTDASLTLCLTVTFGAFGLSTAAGRHPLHKQRWIGCVYYGAAGLTFLLIGPAGPLFILAGCILFLYFGEDPQSLRFFANPIGIALFFLLAAAWPMTIWLTRPVGWDGHWGILYGWFAGAPGQTGSALRLLGDLWLASLPWTPLIVLALGVGIWRGHASAPAWRLFGGWALGPLILMAVGMFRSQPHLGVILPPLAVMAAMAVAGLLQWIGRSKSHVRSAMIAALWLLVCGAAIAALRQWGAADPRIAALPVAIAGTAGLLLVMVTGTRRAATTRSRGYATGALAALLLGWLAAGGDRFFGS